MIIELLTLLANIIVISFVACVFLCIAIPVLIILFVFLYVVLMLIGCIVMMPFCILADMINALFRKKPKKKTKETC